MSGSDWNGRATERTTVFRYYISIIMYKYIYIYIYILYIELGS